jgi:hypothetical protein
MCKQEFLALMDELEDTGKLPECKDCNNFIGYNQCDAFVSIAEVVMSDRLRPMGRCRACTVKIEEGAANV